MPGRSTLTATGLSVPSGSRTLALCTCAIEAAATGGPNSAKSVSMGAPKRLLDGGARLALRERRQAVLQRGEIAGKLAADEVVAGGEKLAELDVGRAERGQRFGELRLVRRRPAPFLRSGAVTRANSASGAGRVALVGQHARAGPGETAPALVSRAILAMAFTLVSS